MGAETDSGGVGGLSVTALKIILACVMILLTLVFGLLPIRVLKYLRKSAAAKRRPSENEADPHDDDDLGGGRRWPGLVLCLLSCFTGGVFLGTCFLHLLPEVNERLIEMKIKFDWDTEYPISELVSCLGFFLVFFVEEIVVSFLQGGHSHSHSPNLNARASTSPVLVHVHGGDHSPRERRDSDDAVTEETALQPRSMTPATVVAANTVTLRGPTNNGQTMTVSPQNGPTKIKTEAVVSATKDNNKTAIRAPSPFSEEGTEMIPLRLFSKNGPESRRSVRSLPAASAYRHPHAHSNTLLASRPSAMRMGKLRVFTSLEVAEPERCEGPCDGQDEDPPILMTSRPHAHSHEVRSITLVLALSFHSVIEGIAFGIADNQAQVTALFLTLIVHKVIVAFSVGLQLARTHAHQLRLVLFSVCLLAVMSPLGMTIGILIQEQASESEGKEIVLLIFEGMAVGTFIYVTFFEVLIHERDNEHPNLLKLLVVMVGFGLIAALRLMEHDHGDDHVPTTPFPAANLTTPLDPGH